jgi:hypothetical protein
MSTEDFNVHYDEVGVEHRSYGGAEFDQVVKVEPPKPPPRLLLKLWSLVRRRALGSTPQEADPTS